MMMTKKKKEDAQDPLLGEFDMWSSWNWLEPETTLPPLYVHPFVRRSSSCLSEKSLEICTESLGSESGSDGLPSFQFSGTGSDNENSDGKNEGFCPAALCRPDSEHDSHEKPSFHARPVISRIKEVSRSFPPPLSSLSSASNSSFIRMRSRRENGRLVLEAVSIPYHKTFEARRENGRLTLTFATSDVEGCDHDHDVVYSELTEKQEMANEVESEDGDNALDEGMEWTFSNESESVKIAASSPCIDKREIAKIGIAMDTPDKLRELVFFEGMVRVANHPNVDEHFWMSNPMAATATSVTHFGELTQPLRTSKSQRKSNEDSVTSHEDHDWERNDRREVQVVFKDYNKSVEDCWAWAAVMKNSMGRSLFPPGATLQRHVMT